MVEQSEIEKINNSFMKLKELEKNLNENPDNIVNLFKEFPFISMVIYLNIKNNNIGFEDMHYNIEISSTLNFSNDYTSALVNYFYSKSEIKTKFRDNIFRHQKFEIIHDIMENIVKELNIMNDKYYLLMEFNRRRGIEEDVLYIIPSSHFKSYFLLPIYNGTYNRELEKIFQQYLMKNNLKKGSDI